MNGEAALVPVHPVIAIDYEAGIWARLVIGTMEEFLDHDPEWIECHDAFGDLSAERAESRIDVKLIGEGSCSTIRIVAGSCGPRPDGGHWTRTLDVTGQCEETSTLAGPERVRATVAFAKRVLTAATSPEALDVDDIHQDASWNAGRRHAACIAALIGTTGDPKERRPLAEVRVRHPYGGAPGIVQSVGTGTAFDEASPCDVALPELGTIAWTGTHRDGTVYISGATRTASISAAMIDPVTTLRLLKELDEAKSS